MAGLFQFFSKVVGRSPILRFAEAGEAWAHDVGPLVLGALQDEAPVATGALRDSITWQVEHGELGLHGVRVEFYAGVPYTGFVLGGTQPHEIVPASASVLHFITKDGDEVFTTRVQHPGTAPNPFNRRAYERTRPQVVRALAEAVVAAVRP